MSDTGCPHGELRSRRLAFAIHDLNHWGGQDRSTLEIIRHLALSHGPGVEAHSFTLHPSDGLSLPFQERKVFPNIPRPLLLKALWYYAVTSTRWLWGDRPVIHSTGACSLISDVVQVQFVHAAWKSKRKGLQSSGFLPKSEFSLKGSLFQAYHWALQEFNIRCERLAFSERKTYIAISESVAEELKAHFPVRDVQVIRHGVDSSQFHPSRTEDELAGRESLRSELGVRPGQAAILFVGSYDRKGLATAIRALALLSRAARMKSKLVVVGDGEREKYQQLAQEIGVADLIRWVGTSNQIGRYYQACDLFVLPTGYEPFGLVILEAMASGLPPIVSRVAGAAELISHGQNGFLIQDHSNARECASYLQSLIDDPGHRETLGTLARKAAEGRGWKKVAQEYAAALEPWLSSGARDPGPAPTPPL